MVFRLYAVAEVLDGEDLAVLGLLSEGRFLRGEVRPVSDQSLTSPPCNEQKIPRSVDAIFQDNRDGRD